MGNKTGGVEEGENPTCKRLGARDYGGGKEEEAREEGDESRSIYGGHLHTSIGNVQPHLDNRLVILRCCCHLYVQNNT